MKVLEYYNVNEEYCNVHGWYSFRFFQKVKFDENRSFERVGDGKRIVVPKGKEGYVTANYTLLFDNDEVFVTDDIIIYADIPNCSGLVSFITDVLEENKVFERIGNENKLDVEYWIRQALERLRLSK